MQQIINSTENTPLFLEGWQEFNRIKWGVRPKKISLAAETGLPSIDTIFYLNKKDKIYIPPLNPYMAVKFKHTHTDAPFRLSRQWLEMAELFIKEISYVGIADTFGLPPFITDVRPWQWARYKVGVKYTYYIDFPYDLSKVDKSVRRSINKSLKYDYVCRKTEKMADVYSCMVETEARQGFSHRLSLQDLELARELLGDEHFRAYVCYTQDGEPISSVIELHQSGARAIGWVGGTKTKYLSSGANQLLTDWILKDLQAAGASGYDFAGANIAKIAATKANWGGKLMPFYTVGNFNLKQLARWFRDCWKFYSSVKRR